MRSGGGRGHSCTFKAEALKQLSVWIEGVDYPIGWLADLAQGVVGFAYTDEWLQQHGAFAISLSLPLAPGVHDDQTSRAFFKNLLNENDQLNQLLRREGMQRSDIVGILTFLGADCPGALSCLPTGSPSVKRPGNLAEDYDVIDDATLHDLIKRLAAGRPLPVELRDPSPVAGFRRKLSLAVTLDGRFAVPKAGRGVPTTHILKIPDPGHPGEAQQEAAAGSLAAQCGFSVAVPIADTVEGQDILLISRFDRVQTRDGLVTRLHQEDFAQALGLDDDLKYERRAFGSNRFDAAAIATVLDRTEAPARAREQFLKTTLFNLMIGNTDNHAKNHALLYPFGHAPSLAPLYDMVPIPLGEGYSDEFAFRIGRASRARELTLADLVSFSVVLGVPATRAKALIVQQVAELAVSLDRASAAMDSSLKMFDRLIGREMNRLLGLCNLDLNIRQRAYLPERQSGGWAMS